VLFDPGFEPNLLKESFKTNTEKLIIFVFFDPGFEPNLLKQTFKTCTKK